MHDFVTHKDLAAYAVARVNVPSDNAKARRQQVAHLRSRLEAYIADHPDLRFKSFMAELIVAHLYDNGWNSEPFAVKDYPRAFEQFLGYIVQSGLKEAITFSDNYDPAEIPTSYDSLQVWDPVNPANNVAKSYTDDDRQRIVNRCSQALDQVTWAGMSPTKTASVEAWQTLFGPSFPGA